MYGGEAKGENIGDDQSGIKGQAACQGHPDPPIYYIVYLLKQKNICEKFKMYFLKLPKGFPIKMSYWT